MLNKQKVTVRGLIDQIYKKERMYINYYDKDNMLSNTGTIFNLDKVENLKSYTGVEKKL